MHRAYPIDTLAFGLTLQSVSSYDDKFSEIYLFDPNNLNIATVKGFDECYYFQDLGMKHPYRVNNLRIPFVNVFVMILMLNGIFHNLRNTKNKKF